MRSTILPFLLVASTVSGCFTERTTDPARTATEQLLISTAVDRAVRDLPAPPHSGRTVLRKTELFDG
jgi:hypothetical protein